MLLCPSRPSGGEGAGAADQRTRHARLPGASAGAHHKGAQQQRVPRSRRRSCCSGGSRSCWALGPVHSIRGDRGRAAEQKATAAEKAAVAARAARQKVAAQLEEVNKALEAQEAEAARVEEEVCAFCVRTARGSLSRAPGAISTGLSHAHACICAPYRTACDKPARFRECEHVRDRDHDCDSLGRRTTPGRPLGSRARSRRQRRRMRSRHTRAGQPASGTSSRQRSRSGAPLRCRRRVRPTRSRALLYCRVVTRRAAGTITGGAASMGVCAAGRRARAVPSCTC